MTFETEFTDGAARWTDLASDYEAVAEPFTRQYAHAALAMVGGIGLGTRVLDVAAGTGALSLLAAEVGAHVALLHGAYQWRRGLGQCRRFVPSPISGCPSCRSS